MHSSWDQSDIDAKGSFPRIRSDMDPGSSHYYRMLLTRHYDQRPFDKTMCDALIANGDVKNRQKRCKAFAMAETSNMVKILVMCTMGGHTLDPEELFVMSQNNKNGQPYQCVRDIWHTVHSDELCAIRECNRNGQPDQGVCDIRHTVHSDELFLIREENRNGST